MPVLEFNSGSYDLNLIREHFGEQMVENNGADIRVAKKANKNMFMATPKFKFLVIITSSTILDHGQVAKRPRHMAAHRKNLGFPMNGLNQRINLISPDCLITLHGIQS